MGQIYSSSLIYISSLNGLKLLQNWSFKVQTELPIRERLRFQNNVRHVVRLSLAEKLMNLKRDRSHIKVETVSARLWNHKQNVSTHMRRRRKFPLHGMLKIEFQYTDTKTNNFFISIAMLKRWESNSKEVLSYILEERETTWE